MTCQDCNKEITETVDIAHYHLYNYCELCYLQANDPGDDESWAKGC